MKKTEDPLRMQTPGLAIPLRELRNPQDLKSPGTFLFHAWY